MGKVKADANEVIATATSIKALNDQMRDEFSKVQTSITKLNASWDGSAATNSIRKFNTIKSSFCNSRYDVIDNYVRFLYEQVGAGYEQTESVNKSLADAFK